MKKIDEMMGMPVKQLKKVGVKLQGRNVNGKESNRVFMNYGRRF
jgi:hypothetical protein